MANILLVEPDHVLAGNIKRVLNKKGHKLVWVVEAQAAITAADKKQPDLIIVDLMLAGRSGVEFLYELRSYPEWASLPVVVFSNLSPKEISPFEPSLAQLNVQKIFYKATVSLAELTDQIDQLAQPASV